MIREHSSFWRGAVVFLLVVHALLLLYGIRCHFATRNEVAHVPAGLAIWKTGTFSLYRVNPPLWRMLGVLPVLAALLSRVPGREQCRFAPCSEVISEPPRP